DARADGGLREWQAVRAESDDGEVCGHGGGPSFEGAGRRGGRGTRRPGLPEVPLDRRGPA
ncbi:hypothetical protein, partial [Streptomyces sp. FM008]|uniref:hypothetical protein n=1 Tax=Streptomyces sp. FM008 TaxID=1983802 RepID=UPI001CA4D4B9